MFAGDPEAAHSLRQAGFNLIHLANNHVGEHGVKGLDSTMQIVKAAGIATLGVGTDSASAKGLVRTDVNGLRIGWLGCGRTLLPQREPGPRYWEFDETELLAAVRQARAEVDVLIVSIHIGLMYLDYPRPEHKLMAERLMSAGADLILMHHAHVLQGVQVTPDGSVCCFNLGNFLLDWREGNVEIPVAVKEQNEGAVFFFELDARGVATAAALPTYIDEECRVHWALNERGHNILSRLERISRDLEGDFSAAFERQRAERNTGGILRVLAFHAVRGNWRYVCGQLAHLRLEHLRMLRRWALSRLHLGQI
jgi:poly-gamma-glutamate synthesis protein (capsule biosynthesis protein)